jgi:hypothetical protein
MHAGQAARSRYIDAADAGVRVGTAHKCRFQHSGKFQIVNKAPIPPDQWPVFDPQH